MSVETITRGPALAGAAATPVSDQTQIAAKPINVSVASLRLELGFKLSLLRQPNHRVLWEFCHASSGD